MLSGQLAPSSSANFASNQPHQHHQQQPFYLEGDSKFKDSLYGIDRFQPSNSSTVTLYPTLPTTAEITPYSYYESKLGAGSQSASNTGYYSSPTSSQPLLPAEQVLSFAKSRPSTTSKTNTGATPKTGVTHLSTALPTTPTATTTTTTTAKTNITSSVTSVNSAAEASGRSAALERAYVHDVYENCEEPVGPIRPRVAQFLAGLDPGSIVCDVGCGNGRYLTACNPLVCTIGVDRCYRLTKIAREKHSEVAICDNLELPFRDESFDAVLSLAVVHHFATTERRVGAIRELARILRIGGRVIISVWALEQKHRRFESQDVLIPWQPPKNRTYNYSDDDDDDEYLPPYHAYTEDSTNSSRSAGDGDSSSLSSSSPGESCYSFVRRAIQKLAGGRKHPRFLDSWNSKDTKNDSSLEYEDAKDLPIELRRLEDFEDFPEPPLSAGLKSRSLGSILNPPPRQIVRSRSSVPSLGAQMPEPKPPPSTLQQFMSSTSPATYHSGVSYQQQSQPCNPYANLTTSTMNNSTTSLSAIFQHQDSTQFDRLSSAASTGSATSLAGRRPKLVKQKQSLCDEDSQQLPDNPLHISTGNISSNSNLNHSMDHSKVYSNSKFSKDSKIFLRKQSSLNEELMAENRLREKERVRKRIQKQMSLNEAFLCRSMFTKRLQVIREGFTTKLKTSTGNLERVTKNGLVKIMQNIKSSQFSAKDNNSNPAASDNNHQQQCHHHHHHHHQCHHNQWSSNGAQNGRSNSVSAATTCPSCCCCTNTQPSNNCTNNTHCSNMNNNNGSEDQKPRRHSRESGSDSSKDSSLQSDTSIESEDSFASVIFIPRPEINSQSQQPQHHHQCSQNCSNSCSHDTNNVKNNSNNCKSISNSHKIPSVPTSPMIMPCPPTPAHSPAATVSASTLPSSTTITTQSPAASAAPSTANKSQLSSATNLTAAQRLGYVVEPNGSKTTLSTPAATNCFIFDEDHIQQHQKQLHQQVSQTSSSDSTTSKLSNQTQKLSKITRQLIKDLPPIPKFRKAQSLQQQANKVAFPIVRRLSAAPIVPKLMSLEIFNPETDDLDSDSSEPSSPDSIDSVISALKPNATDGDQDQPITQHQLHKQELEKIQKEQMQQLLLQAQQSNVGSNNSAAENITDSPSQGDESCRQHLVDFAEKLSAQLLKELDESNKNSEIFDEDDKNYLGEADESDTAILLRDRLKCQDRLKSTNPFARNPLDTLDVSMKREELRERRLMLANLTRSASPTSHSSTPSSASSHSHKSQSSKAKSSSSYSELFEDSAQNRRFKTFRSYTNDRQHQHYINNIADTTYLLPKDDDDDDENSYRSNELDGDCEIEHDVIMEEDEDQEDEDAIHATAVAGGKIDRVDSKEDKHSAYDENDTSPHSPCELPLDERPSNESWGHSNSTTSLDSPSQSGGSTTHHRYYHVFREGELDALINHHVASLHIVSSYYERASWCVVAEKVQVWTI